MNYVQMCINEFHLQAIRIVTPNSRQTQLRTMVKWYIDHNVHSQFSGCINNKLVKKESFTISITLLEHMTKLDYKTGKF